MPEAVTQLKKPEDLPVARKITAAPPNAFTDWSQHNMLYRCKLPTGTSVKHLTNAELYAKFDRFAPFDRIMCVGLSDEGKLICADVMVASAEHGHKPTFVLMAVREVAVPSGIDRAVVPDGYVILHDPIENTYTAWRVKDKRGNECNLPMTIAHRTWRDAYTSLLEHQSLRTGRGE